MHVRSVASAARREGRLRANRCRVLALAAAFAGTELLPVPGANAQVTQIEIEAKGGLGGLFPATGVLCVNVSGQVFRADNASCSTGTTFTNGNIAVNDLKAGSISTAGNITAGTLTTTGNTLIGNGGDDAMVVNAATTLNGPTTIGNKLSAFADVTLGDSPLHTLTVKATSTFKEDATFEKNLNVGGKATLDSLEVTKGVTVGGTLAVDGLATFDGGLTATSIGAKIIAAENIFTNSLKTTFDVEIGGNLDMTGGDITNVKTITATTGNFDTLTTTGKATLGSLEVTSDAEVKGNLTVGGDTEVKGKLTVAKGVTVSESFTVTPGSTIDMGGNRIQNVADPIALTDAATKGYVDAKLASAFKEIDRNTQGIAIAMAMTGLALPADKNFALGANIGFFEDKQAMAVQAAIRVNPFVTITGGFGTGIQDMNTVGGRVGLQVAW